MKTGKQSQNVNKKTGGWSLFTKTSFNHPPPRKKPRQTQQHANKKQTSKTLK